MDVDLNVRKVIDLDKMYRVPTKGTIISNGRFLRKITNRLMINRNN